MTRRVSATVDLAAIRHNLSRVAALVPGARIMAAVKGNAYGHGAAPVALAIDDAVDAFAVACLEEAVELTQAGCRTRCVLLEGILDAAEIPDVASRGDVLVLHHDWQLAALAQARLDTPVDVWIKLDTGMHRLGFPPQRARELAAWVEQTPQVQLVGWMTHLANADARDPHPTREQIGLFETATSGLPGARSLANSAGLIAYEATRADWVRPGLMLYGASPLADRSAADLGLRPAMHVTSRLISVRDVPAGAAIGYGSEWICAEPTRLGVVAVGYGDGYPRHAASGTPVLVGGRRAALIGRVSMDMITVDLRGIPDAQVGDPVTLWGAELPAEDVAAHAATISYDLFCGLTSRVVYRHADMGE